MATVANKIGPMWDDNNMTGGTIQYLTVGNTLTVQWLGMHVAGIGSTTNPTIDMQVILNGMHEIQV
ncbi:MAG: hypothetical protein IPN61_01685 [Bacteroidetes bacterium]|nr:hypothetical protein [Bacteroidota bacterium]